MRKVIIVLLFSGLLSGCGPMKGIEASEVSGSNAIQSQGPISSTTSNAPEPKANKRAEEYAREKKREVLAGLQGVWVLVEGFRPEDEKYGFNKQQFRTDVELQLRQYGVKVLSEDKSYKVSGKPYLYINVNPLIDEKVGKVTMSISVNLNEDVLLDRNPTIRTVATTWNKGGVLRLGFLRLDEVRDVVKDYVDMFINDYLAANPKDSTTKTIQQTYVVPKNALIDMNVCASSFQIASDPNRPQELKAWSRSKGLELFDIQTLHLLQLGIKPEDVETRMSVLAKGDIMDMPPEVFDYIKFEDDKKMSP